jgi:hypothetical protein
MARGVTIRAARAVRVLENLQRHGLRDFHITGRLALEAHYAERGQVTAPGTLQDVDLVVSGFDSVPETLAEGFIASHVHPKAAGKLVLQLVDAEEALRIDIFSA